MDGPSDKSIETTVHALHSHSTPMNMKEGWDSQPPQTQSLPMTQWLAVSGTKGNTVARGGYTAGDYAMHGRGGETLEIPKNSKQYTSRVVGFGFY